MREDTSTGSTNSMTLAHEWLKWCLDEHAGCKANGDPLLPTRVLDVQSTDGSPNVRLYVKPDKEEQGSYATLSHCWGKHSIITTTRSNINAHETSIEWSALSQTFRDAITVIRELGIRYLWIDSLCIIQDSIEDWEKESAVMGRIYQESILTLSAVHAMDGSAGCFIDRNPMANRPCKLETVSAPIHRKKRRRNSLSASDDSAAIYAYPRTYPWPVGPLYERAWVYQEQALSRRTLAFGKDNMYWRCQTVVATENEPTGGNVDYKPNMSDSRFMRFILSKDHVPESTILYDTDADSTSASDSSESGADSLYDMWYSVVADYSKRAITENSDRLPALSGLASELHGALVGDHYIAGLWHQDAPRCLLWSCPDRTKLGNRARPPQHYVAPTWSWASLTGCLISYDFAEQILRDLKDPWHKDLEILAFTRTLKGSNPFGEVTNGILKVKGRLLEVVARSVPTQEASEMERKEPAGRASELYESGNAIRIGTLNADERVEDGTVLRFLAMVHENESNVVGLALRKTPLQWSATMEYQRVGLAGVDADIVEESTLKTLIVL